MELEQQASLQGLGAPAPLPPGNDLPDGRPHRDVRGRVCNRFCPVCTSPMHADKQGMWECKGCGAAGGSFKGKRLYMTAWPNTDAGHAAAARLASST